MSTFGARSREYPSDQYNNNKVTLLKLQFIVPPEHGRLNYQQKMEKKDQLDEKKPML